MYARPTWCRNAAPVTPKLSSENQQIDSLLSHTGVGEARINVQILMYPTKATVCYGPVVLKWEVPLIRADNDSESRVQNISSSVNVARRAGFPVRIHIQYNCT